MMSQALLWSKVYEEVLFIVSNIVSIDSNNNNNGNSNSNNTVSNQTSSTSDFMSVLLSSTLINIILTFPSLIKDSNITISILNILIKSLHINPTVINTNVPITFVTGPVAGDANIGATTDITESQTLKNGNVEGEVIGEYKTQILKVKNDGWNCY